VAAGEPSTGRTRRAITRKLESLRDAGVTHLPKPRRPKAVAPRSAVAEPKRDQPPAKVAARAVPLAVSRPEALSEIAQAVAQCTRCAELARTRTQTVFGAGNPHSRLVFMGEAPGADEDRQGEPFVGRAGQLLTDIITKGMKLRREDVYILNTIKCRPPENRTPAPAEIANCREYLDKQLAILEPEFLCCLGAVATQALLGIQSPLGKLRGRFHDFRGIKVICTYHPAYVLRYPESKRQVWDDIKILMKEMGLPV